MYSHTCPRPRLRRSEAVWAVGSSWVCTCRPSSAPAEKKPVSPVAAARSAICMYDDAVSFSGRLRLNVQAVMGGGAGVFHMWKAGYEGGSSSRARPNCWSEAVKTMEWNYNE